MLFRSRGRDVVAGEVAASALALTLIQLALLAAVVAASLGTTAVPLTGSERTALAAAVALALPGVNLTTLTIQNAAALLFPGWARAGATAGRGIEAMGQNIVSSALSLALTALLLAGPGLLALGVFLTAHPRLGVWAYAPAALAGSAAAVGQLVPAFRWLGRVFERTDPTSLGAAS